MFEICCGLLLIFYDMTTLYFEAQDEDDFRKIGFSKDGKFQDPQIMLGLLVGEKGYPIGYELFEGNTFEGHTLIPVLEKFQKKFDLDKPIVVADSGLLSKANLKTLKEKNYCYIIGARVKNDTHEMQAKILGLNLCENGKSATLQKENGDTLVITYTEKRARKDAHNRRKGLQRLEKRISSGKLTKDQINNRGYNKYLTLKSDIDVEIDYDRFNQDAAWDGLKGYVTNTDLAPEYVIENYSNLWHIEKAFRMSKSDLQIRPIYHYAKRRIEAHISISFVAYTIYKELERLLYKHNAPFSVQSATEIVKTIYQLDITLPDSKRKEKILLNMDNDQRLLLDIIQNEVRVSQR
jgi:transposase